MRFPTGGIVREQLCMNRCDSGTDSKVWMREEMFITLKSVSLPEKVMGFFYYHFLKELVSSNYIGNA